MESSHRNADRQSSLDQRLDRLAEAVADLPADRSAELAEQLNKPFYTVPEVAELLGMHPETIRRALREGRLIGVKLGGRKSHYRIPAEALERFIQEKGH